MAYVRKTDTLVNEILRKVRDMSQTAQKPYSADTLTKDSAELMQYVIVSSLYLGKVRHNLNSKCLAIGLTA